MLPSRTFLIRAFLLAAVVLFVSSAAMAVDLPEFIDTNHQFPETKVEGPRGAIWDVLDVAALLIAMAATTWFVLIQRSRTGVFWTMMASLAYFGFWRHGCICPIGSIQNVALALFDPSYALPWVVAAFFVVPLIGALLFGRVFCGGVCPLGAIQDVVGIFPIQLPRWLTRVLGTLPWAVLAWAVWSASTGMGFPVCRYDPFVGFFRFGGSSSALLYGGLVLVAGVFIARPYCRFLCPYGALLGVASCGSWRHMTITPDECISCRLCESACPYDAIDPAVGIHPGQRSDGLRRLGVLLLLGPILAAAGAWAGQTLAEPLMSQNPQIVTLRRVQLEQQQELPDRTEASLAYRETDASVEEADLTRELAKRESAIRTGGLWAGLFVGFVLAWRLAAVNIRRMRKDYVPHRTTCVSCMRCASSCPITHQRRREKEAGS
jgi:NosR/NirI family nitrous oxide reductase transcriptional regulator